MDEISTRLNKIERKLDKLLAALAAEPQVVWIPIGVAAKKLGITTNALRMRALRGTIGCKQDRGRYYFNNDEVTALAGE